MLRALALSLSLLILHGTAFSQVAAPANTTLSAEAIMSRVAANQDRAESARTEFVYVQHARVQSRKGNTVMCEEITDTRITPAPKGQTQTLLALTGHVQDGHRVIRYTALPRGSSSSSHQQTDNTNEDRGKDKDKDVNVDIGEKEIILDADAGNAPIPVSNTDIDLVENMRTNLTSDKEAKDGVRAGLFPLTSAQQKQMDFTLKGREPKNGRDTYHILFRPKDKADFNWKGEAWIDTTAFQPVVVRTELSRGIPLGVRLLLGTNLPGLGFTAIYAPQQDGVWFPASFGTEFKVRVLFAFHRQIVMSVENRSFERTHVSTTVHAEEAKPVVPGSEPDKKP